MLILVVGQSIIYFFQEIDQIQPVSVFFFLVRNNLFLKIRLKLFIQYFNVFFLFLDRFINFFFFFWFKHQMFWDSNILHPFLFFFPFLLPVVDNNIFIKRKAQHVIQPWTNLLGSLTFR